MINSLLKNQKKYILIIFNLLALNSSANPTIKIPNDGLNLLNINTVSGFNSLFDLNTIKRNTYCVCNLLSYNFNQLQVSLNNFNPKALIQNTSVNSNFKWTQTNVPSWLIPHSTACDVNDTITFTSQKNDSAVIRSATKTITANALIQNINVSQYATTSVTTYIGIINPDRIDFASLNPLTINNALNVSNNVKFILPRQDFFVKAPTSEINIKKTNKNEATPSISLLNKGWKQEYTILNLKNSQSLSYNQTTCEKKLIRLWQVDDVQYEENKLILNAVNNISLKEFDEGYYKDNNLIYNTLTSDNSNTENNFLPKVAEVSKTNIGMSTTQTKTDYRLIFTDLNAAITKKVKLKDNYLGTLTPINAPYSAYNFGIDSIVATSFGNNRFALLISPIAPLPIKLKAFTLGKKSLGPLLNRATLSQKDVSHFEVPCFTDRETITEIDEVKGKTIQKTSYNLVNKTPKTGDIYCHLKSVDGEGKIEVPIVSLVNINLRQNEKLTIYPNPVKEDLNVKWNFEIDGEKTVSVLDFEGKILLQFTNIKDNNLNKNLNSLQKGFYILELSNQSNNQTIARRKFIKE